jgi:hypothetical protein
VRMSQGLARHVRQLQTKMVECDAWKQGSILLAYLDEPNLARAFNRQETLASSSSSSSSSSRLPAPVRPPARAPPVTSAAGARTPSPQSPLRVGARLPPRHPASSSSSKQQQQQLQQLPAAGASADGGAAGGGFGGSEKVVPNIVRQVEAFGRRFWMRAKDVLAYLLARLSKEARLSPNAAQRAEEVPRPPPPPLPLAPLLLGPLSLLTCTHCSHARADVLARRCACGSVCDG